MSYLFRLLYFLATGCPNLLVLSMSKLFPAPPDTLRSGLARVIDTNHGTVRGLVQAMLAQTEFVLGRLEDHTSPAGQHIDRLVFVCLGNINRSAFAGQVARQPHDPHVLSDAYFQTCFTLIHSAVGGLVDALRAVSSPRLAR